MEKGAHLKRKNQPTMAQIQYVLELDKLEKKKMSTGRSGKDLWGKCIDRIPLL